MRVPKAHIDQIYIRIQPNANPDVVAQAISQYFGVNVQYLQINVAADIINAYQGNANLAQIIMIAVGTLVILMVLQGFGISAYTMFLERRFEIHMYRALGLSINDVKRMLFWELMLLLLSACLLSIIIGYIGSLGLSYLLAFLFNISPLTQPPFEIIGIVFVAGMLFLYLQFQHIFAKKIKPNLISPYQLLH